MGLNWMFGAHPDQSEGYLWARSGVYGSGSGAHFPIYQVRKLGYNSWWAFLDGREIGTSDSLEFCLDLCNKKERGEV